MARPSIMEPFCVALSKSLYSLCSFNSADASLAVSLASQPAAHAVRDWSPSQSAVLGPYVSRGLITAELVSVITCDTVPRIIAYQASANLPHIKGPVAPSPTKNPMQSCP
ncbi:hypothetical protein IF2G_05745 [Cordyceps javanica]|nr:hypothetical protein IF2G_05745 [Cordyceps javanica]